ncbi:helix-turn-helix domain-containing protein [Romboutsia timonensis]|jgi:DNA-binding XRE family transcriptional regulator|uniref:helix-turn-helix domain-containing protein n=1 Tax=Romboutsia timonensis TaxID=1776391 RepID=UPI002E75C9E4|nr:helix-turn-helix transcriptional regulator [Romboutsia timonensis]MEE0711926.1 helix-turn-helix transcriptional regulator [Romboutsia timonensis]
MRNEHREIDIESLMSAVESLSNEEKILLEAKEIEREFIIKLINVRKEKGITQKELAKKTGLTQQVISTIEQCGRRPTLTNLIRYLIGLDLDINKIFNLTI